MNVYPSTTIAQLRAAVSLKIKCWILFLRKHFVLPFSIEVCTYTKSSIRKSMCLRQWTFSTWKINYEGFGRSWRHSFCFICHCLMLKNTNNPVSNSSSISLVLIYPLSTFVIWFSRVNSNCLLQKNLFPISDTNTIQMAYGTGRIQFISNDRSGEPRNYSDRSIIQLVEQNFPNADLRARDVDSNGRVWKLFDLLQY